MSSNLSRYESFLAAALSNPAICTGQAQDYEIRAWFGSNDSGITKKQIILRQAEDVACLAEESCRAKDKRISGGY